jgi:hypothetical protein
MARIGIEGSGAQYSIEPRRRRLISRASLRTAVCLGALIATLASCAQEAEQETCMLEPAVSDVFEGDPNADPNDRDTWQRAVVATTDYNPDIVAVVFSFSEPNQPLTATSEPVGDGRYTETVWRIGPSAVVLYAQAEADIDSGLCQNRTPTSFEESNTEFDELLARRPDFVRPVFSGDKLTN